jgi:S-ribosylhomocysteine lyase LuxS involved in autoinducer biosynthesis
MLDFACMGTQIGFYMSGQTLSDYKALRKNKLKKL